MNLQRPMMNSPRMSIIPIAVALVAWINACATAHGDVVHLKDGTQVEGHVTYKQVYGVWVEQAHGGKKWFEAHQIDHIEKKPHILDAYYEQLQAVDESDIEGYRKLGKWCKQNGLWRHARAPYAAVLRLDHADKEAKDFLALTEDGEYFEKLRELDDSSWRAHLGLGKWCEESNRREFARKHYLRTIELNPDCQEALARLRDLAKEPIQVEPPSDTGEVKPKPPTTTPQTPQAPPSPEGLLTVEEAEKILKRHGAAKKEVLAEENQTIVKGSPLYESFTDNRNRWKVGRQEIGQPKGSLTQALQKGSYLIASDLKDVWIDSPGLDQTYQNVIFWFQIALMEGYGYGIRLCDKTRTEVCTFSILHDGSYCVSTTIAGKIQPMKHEGSECIRRGANAINFVEIKCVGSCVDFYVNRARLWGMDMRTKEIGFDFTVGPQAKFRVDELLIFQTLSKR